MPPSVILTGSRIPHLTKLFLPYQLNDWSSHAHTPDAVTQ